MNLLYRTQLAIASRLLKGKQAWRALDDLGIPGFGTHLCRFFYQIEPLPKPLWDSASGAHKKLEHLFSQCYGNRKALQEQLQRSLPEFQAALDDPDTLGSIIGNEFYSLFDALVLFTFLNDYAPKQYVEIGSGISTRIAHLTRKALGRDFLITSIDPLPRQEIDALCDTVVRSALEEVKEDVLSLVKPGDVLFYDGSHYVFPANDVVVFFLEILPLLPPGVLVHIHDIYLPYDYPPSQMKHLWGEQYLLAAFLLGGGNGTEIVFPSHSLLQAPEISSFEDALPPSGAPTSALWLRT